MTCAHFPSFFFKGELVPKVGRWPEHTTLIEIATSLRAGVVKKQQTQISNTEKSITNFEKSQSYNQKANVLRTFPLLLLQRRSGLNARHLLNLEHF